MIKLEFLKFHLVLKQSLHRDALKLTQWSCEAYAEIPNTSEVDPWGLHRKPNQLTELKQLQSTNFVFQQKVAYIVLWWPDIFKVY